MARISLDYQSSTPLLGEVLEAMMPWFREHFASAASAHQHGLEARAATLRAREHFTALIHAESPEQIIFTANATEALNLAIRGTAAHARSGRHIVLSAIEHPPVANTVEDLCAHGFSCSKIPAASTGTIEPEQLVGVLREDTCLVCLQHANGDVGAIHDIERVAAVTNQRGIPLLVDATYSASCLELDARALGMSMIALSPHRFFGPKGVGVLYRHRRCRLRPIITGGKQEHNYRAGTENIPAIVGAGVAAQLLHEHRTERTHIVTELQSVLWQKLTDLPGIQLIGPPLGPARLPNHLSISIPRVDGEALMLAADMQGLAIHAGSACLTQVAGPGPILSALGLDSETARAALILSLCHLSTRTEVETAVQILTRHIEKLRNFL